MVTSKTPKTKAKSKLSLTDDEKRLVFNHVVKIKKNKTEADAVANVDDEIKHDSIGTYYSESNHKLRLQASKVIRDWFQYYWLAGGGMTVDKMAQLLGLSLGRFSAMLHGVKDFPPDFEKKFFTVFKPVFFNHPRVAKFLTRTTLTQVIALGQWSFEFCPKLEDEQGREILRILQRDLNLLTRAQKAVILSYLKKCEHENYPEDKLVIVQGGNKKRSDEVK